MLQALTRSHEEAACQSPGIFLGSPVVCHPDLPAKIGWGPSWLECGSCYWRIRWHPSSLQNQWVALSPTQSCTCRATLPALHARSKEDCSNQCRAGKIYTATCIVSRLTSRQPVQVKLGTVPSWFLADFHFLLVFLALTQLRPSQFLICAML